MTFPEDAAKENSKPNIPQTSYQRPGKLGVDYDDYGVEMAPNARVWKRYVEESDKMDGELVDGWNKTLDVILSENTQIIIQDDYADNRRLGPLQFSPHYSQLSQPRYSRFVIESSKDLKPDPAQTSAQTLAIMSQTLLAISRGSQVNESAMATPAPTGFTPDRSAVVVNTLWFMSLSLSVVVSLIAILAKEWCYWFMAGRVGSMLKQGRTRQQRWGGIEQWKMKEILNALPLLMHTALLLFAVGLSVYLWNINKQVALPVVITAVLGVLFYLVSALLPLFFRFCPYKTALVRLVHPFWVKNIRRDWIRKPVCALLALPPWLGSGFKQVWIYRDRRKRRSSEADHLEAGGTTIDLTIDIYDHVMEVQDAFDRWAEGLRSTFSTDRSQLVEKNTQMDNVTSSMICWMISNCETTSSVDMALQALAGAELGQLPRQPLWQCNAIQIISQRLWDCTIALDTFPVGTQKLEHNRLFDNVSLYYCSLGFLTEFIHGEGLEIKSDPSKLEPSLNLQTTRGPMELLDNTFSQLRDVISYSAYIILKHAYSQSSCRYDVAAFVLSNVPANANQEAWDHLDRLRAQCSRQWDLITRITTGAAGNLPSNAVLGLVNGITKTFLYNPSQSPVPLVDLLNMPSPSTQETNATYRLRYAIGVCLTVAAFANQSFPGGIDTSIGSDARLGRAKQAYNEIKWWEYRSGPVTEALLAFGLLSLLAPSSPNRDWDINSAEIKSVGNALASLRYLDNTSYDDLKPLLAATFDGTQHLTQLVLGWLSVASQEGSELGPLAVECLGALLCPQMCGPFGSQIVSPLVDHFDRTQSTEFKILCLQGVQGCVEGYESRSDAVNCLIKTNFLGRLLEHTTSASENVTLHIMQFLWTTAPYFVGTMMEDNPGQTTPLQALCNKFTVHSANGDFPEDVISMGFADLWLDSLIKMCRVDPKRVLDSKILRTMLDSYEYREDAMPRTPDLSDPEPSVKSRTWLTILRELEAGCKATVEGQAAGKETGELASQPREQLGGGSDKQTNAADET